MLTFSLDLEHYVRMAVVMLAVLDTVAERAAAQLALKAPGKSR